MKRSTARRRTASTARMPREIHVRMPAARVTAAPDVWVVNGRVIRFLDPSRPEEAQPARAPRRPLNGLFRALHLAR